MPDISEMLATIYGEEIEITQEMIVLWLNAFIPGTTTNARVVPLGVHQGKTMIQGPMFYNDCFLTDNRSFSDDISASVRMQSLAIFDISSETVVMEAHHRCGETIELDCEDGSEDCQKTQNTNNMKWGDLEGTSQLFKVSLEGAANNPCYTGSPDIDYKADSITIIPEPGIVIFDGAVDEYPSFEAYIQRGSGNTATIFRESHGTGVTPASLFGGAVKKIFKHTTF